MPVRIVTHDAVGVINSVRLRLRAAGRCPLYRSLSLVALDLPLTFKVFIIKWI